MSLLGTNSSYPFFNVAFEAKARALASRFFPDPPADLSDIQDPDLAHEWPSGFETREQVTPKDIYEALKETAPWKAPRV
ncbi:hypothetical protein VTJ04DRAFT_163 [Mycothermus thermophilus]|uniref:uncharacterized protein n=1 Tax=Humicola insolens TaxID=85995 RepID=UPI00374297CE